MRRRCFADMQQAARPAFFGGMLGDSVGRQFRSQRSRFAFVNFSGCFTIARMTAAEKKSPPKMGGCLCQGRSAVARFAGL